MNEGNKPKEDIDNKIKDYLKSKVFDEPLQIKINNQYTVSQLIEFFSKGIELNDIRIECSLNKKILNITDIWGEFLGTIFNPPIKVKYENIIVNNISYNFIDQRVYSSEKIVLFFQKLNITKPYIYKDTNEFLDYYDSIYNLIGLNIVEEIIIINKYKKYSLEN